MTVWLKAVAAVVFLGLFAWLFWLAGGEPSLGWSRAAATPTPVAVKRGNFGKYLYGLTDASENKKVAQFDPSLPTDDAVVIGALKELAQDGFGLDIPEAVQPAVETINETNYITFVVGKDKVLYELFRNSSGNVGTVRFWSEPKQ